MTLRNFLRSILRDLSAAVSRPTYRGYIDDLEAFHTWAGREVELEEVSIQMLERFRDVNPRAAGSVSVVMAHHDPVIFRRSRKRGHTTDNPPARNLMTAPLDANTLSVLYATRYEALALRSRRPNTKRLYRTTLGMFDKFLGRLATLDDLCDETVARFASWRLTNNLSKHSVNKDLSNILALWRWCHRKGLVRQWPDVELEAPPRRQRVAWTDCEMRRLFKTAVGLEGRVGKVPAGDWWAALILVAWDSGKRIGAIIGLDWANVDLDRGWVRFIAEHRKGALEDSTVRLSEDAVAALRNIRTAVGSVFPWPYSTNYIWPALTQILKRAGLPHDSKSKFHRIRKTVASYAEAAGGNATAMLRHSKRDVTNAYLDPRICRQQQPADLLFRLTT